MISPVFRPPQFSEDREWLPPWLQQNQQGSLLDEYSVKDTHSPFMGTCNVQGNHAFERDVLLSAREENGNSKFRLLLSGSDNSPFQMTPSGNLPQFHLHLSPNGTSQYSPSPMFSALEKERSRLNDFPSTELPPQTACPQNRSLPNGKEAEHGLPSAKIDMKSRLNPRSKSPSISKDGKGSQKKHKEKTNCGELVTADITNAVEFSIAASEALAIYELVNNGSASEVLETSAVLEVALHLKQARNQLCTNRLEDITSCVSDTVDEADLLQELDDDIMADAYTDVGIHVEPVAPTEYDLCSSKAVPEHGCSLSGTVSRVLDTPDPEDYDGVNVRLENAKLRSQEVEFDRVSNKRENKDALTMDLTTKDSHSDSLLGVRPENLSDDLNFVVDTFSAETHSEPHLNQSVYRKEETINEIIRTATDCGSLSHTLENLLSSAQIHKRGNDGAKHKAFNTTHGTFRSRWLGGWTGEDVNISGDMPQNTVKRITNFVIRETSYISESADISPEENYSLKKPENGQIIASLPSVAYEGLCSTTKVMELSQDLMLPCNLSMVDPLCSVVPCSISSDDANVNTNTNQSNTDIETDNCLNAISENELGNLRTTLPHADFGNEGHIINITDDSLASTRRQLTSLRAYSMLTPPCKDALDRSANQSRSFPVTGVPEFLNFEENIDCFKSVSRKGINLYCKPASESTSVKDSGNDNGTLPIGGLMTTSTNDKEYSDERRSSPLIFSRRVRRRVRASKILPSNESGGVNLETAPVPKELETRGEFCDQDRSALAPIQSLHSSNPNPCKDQGPARKKVRFSEADPIIAEKRSAPKPRSVYRTRSSTGTGKRSRKFQSRTHDENTCVNSGVIRDKRGMIFRGLEFLLTGFTCKKERELEMLIRKHGGFIVFDVPHPPHKGTNRRFRCKRQQLPVLLSPKKLQTHKFLYGCAINAFLLHVNWLTDSVGAGQLLPPEKYMILPNVNSMKHSRIGQAVQCADITYIFHKLGILLHGNHSFCTNMGNILKHGGGQVFKTIQWLVQSLKKGTISMGAIVVEDESSASRHLTHCASEHNLPVMPANWITESLLLRKLIPLKGSHSFP